MSVCNISHLFEEDVINDVETLLLETDWEDHDVSIAASVKLRTMISVVF